MTEEIYIPTFNRALTFLIRPLLFVALVVAALVFRIHQAVTLSLFESFVFIVFLISITIIPTLLLINHWRISKKIEVRIRKDSLVVINGTCKFIIEMTQLSKIQEISTYGYNLPWSDIRYWEIETNGKKLQISSIVVPKSKMDFYFWNRYKSVFRTFPLMKDIR